MTKVFELLLDENAEGVFAISLVDKPAIMENFVSFSETHKIEFKEIETKKNILLGAVLIPDLKIDRMGQNGEIFQVYLSGETIQKTAYLFMKNGYQGESTLQHKTKVEGVTVVETWLKEDMVNDKSVMYGFDYPINTWMVAISVDNEDIRNKVKNGEIKGFSIEGLFEQKQELSAFEKTKQLLQAHFNN